MKRIISDRGSVLMEFVIVAPMLLLLIFGIIQFAYIFMAKQLTFYAAYSAARTALVYNPKDYRDNSGTGAFYSNKGPLYLAACTIMSWMNAGDGDSSFIYFPRAGADVWNQVKIDGKWYNTDLTWDYIDIRYGNKLEYCLVSDEKFEKDLKGIGYKQYQKFDAENLPKEKIDEYIKKALATFDYSQKGKQKVPQKQESDFEV